MSGNKVRISLFVDRKVEKHCGVSQQKKPRAHQSEQHSCLMSKSHNAPCFGKVLGLIGIDADFDRTSKHLP